MEYFSDFLTVWECRPNALSKARFFHCSDRLERSAVFLCSYETGSLSDYGPLGGLGKGMTFFLRISLEGF